MKESTFCNNVMDEIKLIPEHKLSEIYDLIHYFRIGLEKAEVNMEQMMKFAGCWNEMSEEMFSEFLQEIAQRRKQTFSRRYTGETGVD